MPVRVVCAAARHWSRVTLRGACVRACTAVGSHWPTPTDVDPRQRRRAKAVTGQHPTHAMTSRRRHGRRRRLSGCSPCYSPTSEDCIPTQAPSGTLNSSRNHAIIRRASWFPPAALLAFRPLLVWRASSSEAERCLAKTWANLARSLDVSHRIPRCCCWVASAGRDG